MSAPTSSPPPFFFLMFSLLSPKRSKGLHPSDPTVILPTHANLPTSISKCAVCHESKPPGSSENHRGCTQKSASCYFDNKSVLLMSLRDVNGYLPCPRCHHLFLNAQRLIVNLIPLSIPSAFHLTFFRPVALFDLPALSSPAPNSDPFSRSDPTPSRRPPYNHQLSSIPGLAPSPDRTW
jgi:hypothetical protein